MSVDNGSTDGSEYDKSGWRAFLSLQYKFLENKTTLISRSHSGPLRIQKVLYPESPAICHTLVLHPPGGVAGGDNLNINVDLGTQAHVLITQPGATKWYKSNGLIASQNVSIKLAAKSVLEWFPQESIFFDQVKSKTHTLIDLKNDSSFFTWEIYCFGRRFSNESFLEGRLLTKYQIRLDDNWLLNEQGSFIGSDRFMYSPIGMANKSIWGTFIVYHSKISKELISSCRDIAAEEKLALVGITYLNGMLIARYLGDSSESAKNYFIKIWQHLRPFLIGVEGVIPRIWRT